VTVSDLRPIDADNHYYESLDAFTRHLPREFRRRGVQVLEGARGPSIVVGDRVNRFIPNPSFDPVIVPGCLDLLFRGQIPEGVDPQSMRKIEPLHPEYRDREARLAVMDAQGLDAVVLFPTMGCGIEEALRLDIDATMASLSAFNRWLEDDWGFGQDGRIFAAPMLSLADPVAAEAEVASLVERGARLVHVRPAPVPGANGTSRSLGDPTHDRVWAALAEASLPIAFHLGDSGYNRISAVWGGPEVYEPFFNDMLSKVVVSDRAIHDTMASLIVHGVFTRHPTLRVASIENGSEWLHLLVKRLRKLANQTPSAFAEDPADTVRRHIWVTPYLEEDLSALRELVGIDRVLFGSDWPHGEGLAEPLSFLEELTGFDDHAVARVMRENARQLIGL
jgi:predicted TIM-barrel fold metal-dependent hydrolase